MKLGPPPKSPSDHWAAFFVGLFCLLTFAFVVLLCIALVHATGVYSLLWIFGGLLVLASAYTIGYIMYRLA